MMKSGYARIPGSRTPSPSYKLAVMTTSTAKLSSEAANTKRPLAFRTSSGTHRPAVPNSEITEIGVLNWISNHPRMAVAINAVHRIMPSIR